MNELICYRIHWDFRYLETQDASLTSKMESKRFATAAYTTPQQARIALDQKKR